MQSMDQFVHGAVGEPLRVIGAVLRLAAAAFTASRIASESMH